MGGRGHRLWLGFRLRLRVETPEGDEAGRFAADEAFLLGNADTFCKGSSRIVLRLGLPPKGDAKQIPTIFAIVRPHVLFWEAP